MKTKTNGDFSARNTAQGLLQEERIHFQGNSTAAPFINETINKILLIMRTLADWEKYVMDVKGVLVKSRFNILA
jgi:hypothetical protein